VALLEDQVVLVNGGTQGAGAGIVRAARREGARVTFTGRRRAAGAALAAELPGTAFPQADLADPAQARGSVEQVVAACVTVSNGHTLLGVIPTKYGQLRHPIIESDRVSASRRDPRLS
jgi:NAD(P)-dependent dehydrogenase (short-subunit alcohol dehydrogenase family)